MRAVVLVLVLVLVIVCTRLKGFGSVRVALYRKRVYAVVLVLVLVIVIVCTRALCVRVAVLTKLCVHG